MAVGWLLLLIAFLLTIHHFHRHGSWYDPEDLRCMKWRSHEFWIIVSTALGLLLNALDIHISV